MISILVIYGKNTSQEKVLENIRLLWGYVGRIEKSNNKITIFDFGVRVIFICETDFNYEERGEKYHYIHVEKGVEIDETMLLPIKWDLIKNIVDGDFKTI